jgi:hypothetical protein
MYVIIIWLKIVCVYCSIINRDGLLIQKQKGSDQKICLAQNYISVG